MNLFNGIEVTRVKHTIFVPLPVSAWGAGTPCACKHCKGRLGYFDTMAVAAEHTARARDWTATVHYPELHRSGVYRAKWEAERMREALNGLPEPRPVRSQDVTDVERVVTAVMARFNCPGI